MAQATTIWTDSEQYAICLAYCIMQQADTLGHRYNKSAIRRELIGTEEQPGPLYGRGHSSLEAKLMNVSAVAANYGHTLVKGYKAASNYQKTLGYWYQMARRVVMPDTERGVTTDMQTAVEVSL